MVLHIKQWSSSELTKALYFKNAGVSYQKFNTHFKRSKKKKENPSPGFAMLKTKSFDSWWIKIHLPKAITFRYGR